MDKSRNTEKKIANQYFEGTLQIRNPKDDLVDFIEKVLVQKGDVSIAKVKEVKNGVDLYISSQRFLRTLGNKLQQQFGGQLELSRKLHTRNRMRSRDVYRVNVLLRLPDFKKGDTVTYKGDKILILGMQKKIFAKDIKTGKKLTLSYKDVLA